MLAQIVIFLSAAGPNPFLAEARVHFQAQEFQRCLKRLDQAASWASTTREEAEVSLYRGLCRFGVGDEREAAGDFAHALRIDPAVTLPAWTSPRIQAAFDEVRGQAGVSSPTVASDGSPGVVKSVPRRLGPAPFVVALSGTVVALGVGLGLGIHARTLETTSFSALYEADARAAALGARDFATGANASYAFAAAAAVAAGILLLVHLVAP
ncbi:MAG: hypothetical protein JNJ54_29600 [Myxococcaceae bacterium]|nr:hypothetical protein [Myxococcaceae bacterium]